MQLLGHVIRRRPRDCFRTSAKLSSQKENHRRRDLTGDVLSFEIVQCKGVRRLNITPAIRRGRRP